MNHASAIGALCVVPDQGFSVYVSPGQARLSKPKVPSAVRPISRTKRPRTTAEVRADRRIRRDAFRLILLGVAMGFSVGMVAGQTLGYNYGDRVLVNPLPGEGAEV